MQSRTEGRDPLADEENSANTLASLMRIVGQLDGNNSQNNGDNQSAITQRSISEWVAANQSRQSSSLSRENTIDSSTLFSQQDDNYMNNNSSNDDITSSSCWSTVEVAEGVSPSARSLHAAAVLNGSLYVFGGYDGSHRLNSFHSFSFKDKRWMPVLQSTTSPVPSPRDRCVAVAFGNSFYIHGGFDGTSRVNDLWAFSFSSMNWREVISSQGQPPSARHSHSGVVHNHSLYIFGGYDGAYKADLHCFDFTLSRWAPVPAAGRRPRARYRTTAVVHKNIMIVHGGHDGTRHLSDTYIFNFDSFAWSMLETVGVPPSPRDSHISVVHGTSMFVFGGSGGSALDDLHELQLPTSTDSVGKWSPVKLDNDEKCPRFCHVAEVHNGIMYVFGGYDGVNRLDSFMKFNFGLFELSFEIPPTTLVADCRRLVDDETLSDVTFIVEGVPVYAHKLMLLRCPYFKSMILGPMMESSQSQIPINQVSHPIFLQVLEYLYTDTLDISFDSAMELFQAADLFLLDRLKMMCEKRMLQSISIENAALLLLAADSHSAMALRDKTKKYILSNFDDVSKTDAFEHVLRNNADLAIEIIRCRYH